jgi:hypothetical protein
MGVLNRFDEDRSLRSISPSYDCCVNSRVFLYFMLDFNGIEFLAIKQDNHVVKTTS